MCHVPETYRQAWVSVGLAKAWLRSMGESRGWQRAIAILVGVWRRDAERAIQLIDAGLLCILMRELASDYDKGQFPDEEIVADMVSAAMQAMNVGEVCQAIGGANAHIWQRQKIGDRVVDIFPALKRQVQAKILEVASHELKRRIIGMAVRKKTGGAEMFGRTAGEIGGQGMGG